MKMVSLVKFLDRMLFEFEDVGARIGFPPEKLAEYKTATKQFFDHVLKYDPQTCVRSSYQDKTTHDLDRADVAEEAKREMPSLDVFERWRRFEEANSTEIKTAVKDFYAIKPELEFAI